jgi:hypothetical protein
MKSVRPLHVCYIEVNPGLWKRGMWATRCCVNVSLCPATHSAAAFRTPKRTVQVAGVDYTHDDYCQQCWDGGDVSAAAYTAVARYRGFRCLMPPPGLTLTWHVVYACRPLHAAAGVLRLLPRDLAPGLPGPAQERHPRAVGGHAGSLPLICPSPPDPAPCNAPSTATCSWQCPQHRCQSCGRHAQAAGASLQGTYMAVQAAIS